MMNCQVEFSNPSKIFSSGQEVSGVVNLENYISREISGIFLIINGIAKTEWIESVGAGDMEKKSYYGATQQLIFSKMPLMSNGFESMCAKNLIYDHL